MKHNTDFKDLFIFEMANNHQGSVEHGKSIIDSIATIVQNNNIKAAVKLQFRHYDTFIHPDMITDRNNPKVQRFLSTRLSDEEHMELCNRIREHGMQVMVTPFDERSIELTRKCNVDILKIGSPSLYDFKLLEAVASENKPVIFSSGGCDQTHIDKLYNFFKHRFVDFAIMHCVSIYPTPNEKMNLATIENFKKRYSDVEIGFSTHEHPDNLEPIKIAYSLGARMYEKHVGLPTESISLNKYSTNPEQTDKWVKALLQTKKIIGEGRTITEKEHRDLNLLYRGVFVNKDINKGESITDDDVFFAFPKHEDGILTGDVNLPVVADKDYTANEHLSTGMKNKAENIGYEYLHKVRGFLNESNVDIPVEYEMEISHHDGIENIFDCGCLISTIINNDNYANKILVLLPGQRHPEHYHKRKDETFYILSGELTVVLNKHKKVVLKKGDTLRINKMTLHSFSTETGCVVSEISTTHYNNDSIYKDFRIAKMDRSERKTKISNWVILS